ncbi:MAG: prepilin-type N-terminal cleavage/methylation domain-containing protein [Comamonas sp.]|nr:prepilin-type N-terminal cleavage/methylation domain-containing protein [Comamonas sp.]
MSYLHRFSPSNRLNRPAGFTLIELMVTLVIMALLMLVTVPLASDWIHSAQTRDAHNKLVQSYGIAKALALRNPLDKDKNTTAAVLRIVLDTDAGVVRLLVCSEDPAADTTACAVGGARLLASADYPSSVTTVLGGSTLTATTSPLKVELDNRGGLIAPASTAYTLSRGASQNDETGNLQ